MGLHEDIAAKEQQVKHLTDPKWHDLAMARRHFVDIEKTSAKGKDHAKAVSESIDQGYLNMLDCILKIQR
jgi:hypothetical protein